MKLPNADKAFVSREKIVDYLLNPAHPDNSGKAEFFVQLGFRIDQWELLADALKQLAANGEVISTIHSSHGEKHIVLGRIQSPADRTSFLDSGQRAGHR
jgi:hypothetical protein